MKAIKTFSTEREGNREKNSCQTIYIREMIRLLFVPVSYLHKDDKDSDDDGIMMMAISLMMRMTITTIKLMMMITIDIATTPHQ